MIGYIIGTIFGSVVLVATFIFILISWRKESGFKRRIKEIGRSAEEKINRDLKIWAKKTNNIFIPACLYKYKENRVFEVDGILITSKALMVIEIKSIKGGIEGDATKLKWQKIIGNESFDISNPVIQNDKHIDHIIEMTTIKMPTISLVIYSNRTTHIKIENIPSYALVVKHSVLFDTLDQIEASLPIKITEYDMQAISSAIKSHRSNSRQDRILHKRITHNKGRV